MDWTVYWFMFPVCIGVASVAMFSGISGAAFLTPIFLIGFPLFDHADRWSSCLRLSKGGREMTDKPTADQKPEIRCLCGEDFETTVQLEEHAQRDHKK